MLVLGLNCSMDHKLSISGYSFRLRPVSLEDAAFIVEVRTDPQRNRFINLTSADVEKQQQWLKRYFEEPDDYYFIIENQATGEREGTVGIYGLDAKAKRAEWGRWVVRRDSKSAIPSMLLSFKLAFQQIGLDSLYTHTAAENRNALMALERFGMQARCRLPGYLRIDGRTYDAIEHEMTRENWSRLFRPERDSARHAASGS